jgi:antitoxin component HigA of HigAB toxin-antitoxin module
VVALPVGNDVRASAAKDLVGTFATESVASEVLDGRRELTRKHIEGLARFFKVSPAAYFPTGTRST